MRSGHPQNTYIDSRHTRGARAADRPIRYIPYFRKSSEENTEKQILSLDRQRRWCAQRAEAEGHVLHTALQEEKSAKLPYKRPVFDDLVARLKRGEARGIYTWKLDRLARNPEEAGIIMGMLSRGEIEHIVTSQREYRPGDNALISYVDFGIADQYSRDLSTNVYDGLHNKAALGDYPSHACLGYLNTKFREKGKNKIVPDPERFDKVRQVLRRLLTGQYSVAEVISYADNTLNLTARPVGDRPARAMSRSGWYRFFANPLPSGWYEYPKGSGNWIKGNHPPMVLWDEHLRIQDILGKRGKPRDVRQEHTYQGLIRCGSCPAMVTAEHKVKRQKNGTVHRYVYYHCTKRVQRDCPERSVEVKELERQIARMLERISISANFHQWAFFAMAQSDKIDGHDQRRSRVDAQKQLAAIDRQLETLALKYLSETNATGALLSDDEYLRLKRHFQKNRVPLMERIEDSGSENKNEAHELFREVFDLARFARVHFLKGNADAKRDILFRVGSNRTLRAKELHISLRKPLEVIARRRDAVEREIAQVRTAKHGLDKGQIAEIVARCPTLRSVVNEVRTSLLARE